MLIDSTGLLSEQQAITATARSTNQLDMGAPGSVFSGRQLTRDIGAGRPVRLFLIVTQGFNTLTSLTVSLRTDGDTAFGSPNTIWTLPTIPLASLVVGAKFALPPITGPFPVERYVELLYTVVGTNPTLGAITAGVVADDQRNPTG